MYVANGLDELVKGVAYVAFGVKALTEVKQSAVSLQEHNKLPIKVLETLGSPPNLTVDQQAHWAKVNADRWTSFEPTLLLDADTRIRGNLDLGFKMLRHGWELVMVPSFPTAPGQVLWTLTEKERRATFQDLGTRPHIMLNTGVMFFKKTSNVRALFEAWRTEWLRFKDRDQGALLRALKQCPVRLWLLGAPYNSAGGEIVDHLFGRARQ